MKYTVLECASLLVRPLGGRAGPSTRGGLLHWANVEGDPCRPSGSGWFGADGAQQAKQLLPCNEDVDAAPAAEVSASLIEAARLHSQRGRHAACSKQPG